MLPRIKINYMNGQLGTVGESPDGLFAIICVAVAVASTFELEKPYSIRSMSDVKDLGITESNNAQLYKHLNDFYNEAVNGTEVVVFGISSSSVLSAVLNKDTGSARQLITAMNGKLRALFVSGATAEAGDDGIADAVSSALPVAQALAEWSTADLFAPIFVVLEGSGYAGGNDVKDLSEQEYNRVAVLLGDHVKDSDGACLGTLAGRLSQIPVHRNVGRVRDGALYPAEMWLGNKEVGEASSDVAALYDKAYITPRTYVGKAGYYFTDDRMACKSTDDYASIANRRVIDKAYRVAYDALLDFMLDEIEVNEDGTMQTGIIKSWQQSVENAINRSMTAAGELSATGGLGCECFIDEKQNVLATSKVEVTLRVRPYAYARYIDVNIGFLVNA